MLEMILERIPGRGKYLVLKYLREGLLDFDQIEDLDMQAAARWYLRSMRIREEIHRLREYSQGRRMARG